MCKKKEFKYSEDLESLSPFSKIIDQHTLLINSDKKSKRKFYVRSIRIHGINITMLSKSEQIMKINELEGLLKGINVPFSIIKLEEAIDLDIHNEFYNKIKNNLSSQLDENKSLQTQMRISQLSGNLDVNEEIANYQSLTQQNFYIAFYSENLNTLSSEINFFLENIFRSGLKGQLLHSKEILNIFNLLIENQIISRIDFDLTLEELTKLDLTKIYKINYLKETKKYLSLKNSHYQSIYCIYDYPFEVGMG
jgi:hypothetical protein